MSHGLLVGIDVSKDRFDVAGEPSCLAGTWSNDPAGIRRPVKALRTVGPKLIVLESTGPCHRALSRLRCCPSPRREGGVRAANSGE